MNEIHVDEVLNAVAKRSGGGTGLVESLREIWHTVAGDLQPEEAIAVLWAVHPSALVVGTTEHAAQRTAVARSLYPSKSPTQAVASFRRVLQRPAVRATIDALRAEESLHAIGQRARVRQELWDMVSTRLPDGADPKDIIAHNRLRREALKDLVALDGLATQPPPLPPRKESGEGRKKLLDKLKAIAQG